MDALEVTRLALELANTRNGPGADLDERPLLAAEHDHLSDPGAARAYLLYRGLDVPPGEPTASELAELRAIRDAARSMAGSDDPEPDERLRTILGTYTFRLDLEGRPAPTTTGWQGLAAAAIPGLLALRSRRARLRTCANLDCGWLFIDRSRNHSRVWCDMGSCGSRAKMSRYRRRRGSRQRAASTA